MNRSCETCRFGEVIWRKGDAPEGVEVLVGDPTILREHSNIICRRHPPTPMAVGWSQPRMDERDWCGEHQVEIVNRVRPALNASGPMVMP